MKKALAALLLVSALIFAFTSHVSESAAWTLPEPTANSVVQSAL